MLSSRRKPLTMRDVGVGLFILVGIVIIAVAILFFQPGRHFTSTVRVRTLFASVGGLNVGAPVVMSGIQVGTVTDISFLSPEEMNHVSLNQPALATLRELKSKMNTLNVKIPAQEDEYETLHEEYSDTQDSLKHVRVDMSVQSSYVPYLRQDSVATLQGQGIMGEKELTITTGTPSAPPQQMVLGENNQKAYEIQSEEAPNFNQMLAKASGATKSFDDVMAQIDASIRNKSGTVGELIKDKTVYLNLQSFLQDSARATRYTGDLLASVREGKGTVGKFFTDATLYNTGAEILANVKNGKGTLGQMVSNPSLYDNGNKLMGQMSSMMTQANQGNGTVHKLLNDPSLYNNSTQAMNNMANLIQSIKDGKGSLGKLATDETFYRNANQAVSNLAEVSQSLKNGNGSLGLLMKDKSLYENINELSAQMVAFMKDFRKNPRKYLTVQFSVLKIF